MQLLPVPYRSETIELINPISDENGLIWFHSGSHGKQTEWFSAWPSINYEYLGNERTRQTDSSGISTITHMDWYELLKSAHIPYLPVSDVRFAGGLAGHLTYDLGLEQLHVPSQFEALNYPLATVGRYDWCCHVDHLNKTACIIIQPHCPEVIERKIKAFALSLNQALDKHNDFIQPLMNVSWTCSMSKHRYQKTFEAIKDYILEGDIYQANLTRQWSAKANLQRDDWSLYKQLLKTMPAPFSMFHRCSESSLLSVSPERFVRVRQDEILTQPIKGTRPRSNNQTEDERHKQALLASEKDRAENLMIVDLLRNDLAKNAIPGSVCVDSLFEIHSFENVHHLISTIYAQLKPDAHPIEVLKDAFPGGSITGAPKKRAMEIIDELETVRRGHYCGSGFFLSGDGYLDSNILIRTVTVEAERLTCSGGGGIVNDSELESEYHESEVKIKRILDTLTP